MSDTLDLSILGGQVQDLDRQLRLIRLQLDSLASSATNTNGRLATIDGRLAALEQGLHGLTGEMARGFGQLQQQLTRHSQQLATVQVGLTELRAELLAGNTAILAAIQER